jgi:hypothetical protein
MNKKNLLTLVLFSACFASFAQTIPKMRYEDKIRIREAIQIRNQYGDKIWEGLKEVPFVLLLVTDSIEFLINHPYPSTDFILSEKDPILNTDILFRPKKFPDWYLATFPAVNGVNCIVVGTPEKTNKSSTAWTVTLLHEHFHQYEYTSPDYYSSVDKLELSGGDETGMWQLNYAFPYDRVLIIEQYKKYTAALHKAVSCIDKKSFKKDFKKYLNERTKFKSLLKPADYRYFSFQLWQEGIARYTEYKFLTTMSSYEPSSEMKNLADYTTFEKQKETLYESELNSLVSLSLSIDKRVCFYAIGFAEGLLLDKVNPKWHDKFLADKFYVENYY